MNELSVESWTWEDWEEDDGPNRNTLTAIVPFQNEFGRRLWGQRSPNGQPVPLIGCSECGNETPEDVKALLAAAPNLLAACKLSLEWLDEVCNPEAEDWLVSQDGLAALRQIETAIAKAEGRE